MKFIINIILKMRFLKMLKKKKKDFVKILKIVLKFLI